MSICREGRIEMHANRYFRELFKDRLFWINGHFARGRDWSKRVETV